MQYPIKLVTNLVNARIIWLYLLWVRFEISWSVVVSLMILSFEKKHFNRRKVVLTYKVTVQSLASRSGIVTPSLNTSPFSQGMDYVFVEGAMQFPTNGIICWYKDCQTNYVRYEVLSTLGTDVTCCGVPQDFVLWEKVPR